jgi:hypothetical protein
VISSWLHLRRLERSLAELSAEHHIAPHAEAPGILDRYQSCLAEARAIAGAGQSSVVDDPVSQSAMRSGDDLQRVRLGGSGQGEAGWTVVAWESEAPAGVAGSPSLPLPDASVELLLSAGLPDHRDLAAGLHLVAECFRVLKPGGVWRLVTPDLRAFILETYLARADRHLDWCEAALGAGSPCEAVNIHLSGAGGAHRFVYDYELLAEILTDAGFEVRRTAHNRSSHPELRYLDPPASGLDLYVEATRR